VTEAESTESDERPDEPAAEPPAERSHEDALAEEILADARRQAEKKLDRARRRAKRIVRSARSATKDMETEAVDAAHGRLERESHLILADLPHEEQVRTLQVQDEVVRTLFEQALAELVAAPPKERLDVLSRLASAAILVMPDGRFVLGLSEQDAPLGDRLAGRMPHAVSSESQRIIEVESEQVQGLEGGVIVRSRDAREIVDQSFRARLRRVENRLRAEVAALIFEEEPRG
jgi:vacuolar-type H+-ATPase subunit E/Vma4